MVNPKELQKRLEQAFTDGVVEVYDMTGTKDHYQVQVVSSAFEGLSTLKRHRLVYAPLKDILGGALHALALDTRTPAEMQELPAERS
jgi:stress-induced morphogen